MPPMICPKCKTKYEVRPRKHSSCGYPFEVNGEDRSRVIAEQILMKRVAN